MEARVENPEVNHAEKSRAAFWRLHHKQGLAALKSEFARNPNTTKLFKQHCTLIDNLLMSVWKEAGIDPDCALIAVGGYGRKELYPYSDIDLLILLPENHLNDAEVNNRVEALIGLLWDIGLNVGHSVRSLEECIAEAKKDITVQTNLLEARLLIGDEAFYEQFLREVKNTLNLRHFFDAKLQEQDNRHAKFNDTAYNLEPNIKESPGGLRDLHMILWLTRSMNIHQGNSQRVSNPWNDLAKQNIITTLEARQIRHHEKNLQQLRIRLHFLSGRREDRLVFDFQNELAASLNYVNTPRKRASEQLMQSYYRSVKFINLMNEILLKSLQQYLFDPIPVTTAINERFEARNHMLEAKTAGLLQQQPGAILEAFLLLQKYPELEGMGPALLRNLQRVKNLVNREFRQSLKNKKRFIEILSQANGVNQALRAMNRYGILGSYIPAFGKIIGQMQHDLFHVYTVDEHILNVLANLRRFSKPGLRHEFPLCSELFEGFDAPHLLYLAALFHDIAKGRGGDHSTLGTLDALRFCKLHGLPKADCQLVAWLVEAHLKMSSTAQKSDLSDPSVIEGFAQFVQNERRLTALYLLTVADIRGTSPAVWNAWKARLLESLYFATKHALANQAMQTQQTILTRQNAAVEKLSNYGLSTHSYQKLWDQFGANYFLRHEPDEVVWHSRLLTPHLHSHQPIVRARLSPNGDGIQVMIYTKDQRDIFARICNFFDRMGYNIVQAKIYTTEHDYALNSFIVLDQSGKAVSYSGLLKFIEVELAQKLDGEHVLESPLRGRISRQVKHMPIELQLTVTEADNNNHKLEIIANDRPGLLATVAHQFLTQDIELHNAKINTLGNRAEDSFLISARKGQRLDAERLKLLQEILAQEI
ncbi:MAG: [protein-PII] uridylyltransferase [Methylotenera sp.]|nr:MAG: [protein-PII] uridylyltransferase [Methylotenera sp.]